MNTRKILFVVISLIILLGGSLVLSIQFASMKQEAPRKSVGAMTRYVKAEEVVYQNLTSSLEREGRVVSGSQVTLVSEAAGKIEPGSVALRKGESFKKGDLLAIIYKDEVELALKARKSQFLTTITTILPDLRVDYPEWVEAFEEFFNAIDMDKALPTLPEINDGKVKIFLASRGVLSEYYSILQDEKRLERHMLFAPFDGTFIEVNFEQGSYVNTGGQIAKMIRTDLMEIEVPVENEQSKWIKVGDKVKIKSSGDGQDLDAVVVRKSNFIDPSSQSRSIYVATSSKLQEVLLAGEYKRVIFPGQLIPNAMVLPRSAVFNSDEVFVVQNGRLKKQVITILKYNETTLVFNGLTEGTKVVVEPLINVKENSPVGILGETKANDNGASRSTNGNKGNGGLS